jgi:hypothetical protein
MAAGGGREWRWRGAAPTGTEKERLGLARLGSLLRAVPFGRGKREKSGGWTGGGGFAHLWKRKKVRGERKKRKKKREREV